MEHHALMIQKVRAEVGSGLHIAIQIIRSPLPCAGAEVRLADHDIRRLFLFPEIVPDSGGKPPDIRYVGNQICYFTKHI